MVKQYDARVRHFRDGTLHMWVGVQVDAEWRADLRLALQGGRLVVSEVRLYPSVTDDELEATDIKRSEWKSAKWDTQQPGETWKAGDEKGLHASAPDGGVSVRLLRRIPVHVHERLQVRPLGLVLPDGSVFELPDESELLLQQYQQPEARQGRPPVPDETLLKVAKIYATAVSSGKPVETVAKKMRIKPGRAKALVYRARQHGFLTPATWGRAGGHLTPAAEALLKKTGAKKKRQTKRTKKRR